MDEKVIMRARAEIIGNNNGICGYADFIEIKKGTQNLVKIKVQITGDPIVLTPGEHGIHIHEKGVCEPPFLSAGGHFDPGPAGNTDPDVNHPYHMGDLPNITVDEKGNGNLEAVSTRITLSPSPLTILTGEGTSIMIHTHHDPYQEGEHGSGISGGPRLACGIIQKIP